jgi:hypothetical protein
MLAFIVIKNACFAYVLFVYTMHVAYVYLYMHTYPCI